MRSGRHVLAVALIGVALGGCAGTVDGSADEPGPAPIVDAWTSCAEAAPRAGGVLSLPDTPKPVGDEPEIGRIDPSFTPVAAVLCVREIRPRPGGGQEQVAAERRADEIKALVDALRLPDQRADGNIACTLDMVVPPWHALLDERGRWLRPYLPTNSCGKPRAEVSAALPELRLTTGTAVPSGRSNRRRPTPPTARDGGRTWCGWRRPAVIRRSHSVQRRPGVSQKDRCLVQRCSCGLRLAAEIAALMRGVGPYAQPLCDASEGINVLPERCHHRFDVPSGSQRARLAQHVAQRPGLFRQVASTGHGVQRKVRARDPVSAHPLPGALLTRAGRQTPQHAPDAYGSSHDAHGVS